jgi:hypothetical protein
VDFLLIRISIRCLAGEFGGISHTVIQDVVHRMRQFCSMRSNKWQHIAQTLRFEWLAKEGIIGIAQSNCVGLPGHPHGLGRGAQGAKTRPGDRSCIQDLANPIAALKGVFMADTVVKLRLNQQQLELMDRTIAQGVAPDRVALVRLALREYAAARKAEAVTGTAR